VISAANQYGLADKAITFVVLLGISIPSFFLGMMMILIFAVNLRWFPVSGMWPIFGDRTLGPDLDHLAMPATALAVVATGRRRAPLALGHAGGPAAGLHPHRARQGRP
jgi:peptide/nickel transport system permease protein